MLRCFEISIKWLTCGTMAPHFSQDVLPWRSKKITPSQVLSENEDILLTAASKGIASSGLENQRRTANCTSGCTLRVLDVWIRDISTRETRASSINASAKLFSFDGNSFSYVHKGAGTYSNSSWMPLASKHTAMTRLSGTGPGLRMVSKFSNTIANGDRFCNDLSHAVWTGWPIPV